MTKPEEVLPRPSPADKEQYKAKITSCILYCPIGIMSERLTNEIYTKWESMPIKYFFNRLVVKSLTMPLNKAQFLSGKKMIFLGKRRAWLYTPWASIGQGKMVPLSPPPGISKVHFLWGIFLSFWLKQCVFVQIMFFAPPLEKFMRMPML